MSSRIISLNYTPCIFHLTKNVLPPFILLAAPTMYGLPYPFPQTYHLGETLSMGVGGGILPSSKNKCSFPTPEITPHQITNFRLYVQIYHANFDKSMITESYLQYDKIIEWSKFHQAKLPTPFSTFQCYLENPASIFVYFPFYSFPFSFQTL